MSIKAHMQDVGLDIKTLPEFSLGRYLEHRGNMYTKYLATLEHAATDTDPTRNAGLTAEFLLDTLMNDRGGESQSFVKEVARRLVTLPLDTEMEGDIVCLYEALLHPCNDLDISV